MFSNSSFKNQLGLPRAQSRGFTLVEMITVVAIILIMTAILLGNLPNFRDKTSLDLIAQEIAVTIRQAQVFGSGTRTAGDSKFRSYGVYLDSSQIDNFIIFADSSDPPNGRYNAVTGGCQTVGTECREQFFLNRGVVITGLEYCSGTCSPYSGILNITFLRPLTDAYFYDDTALINPQAEYVKINIAKVSKPSDTRSIIIWGTGHIYVNPT